MVSIDWAVPPPTKATVVGFRFVPSPAGSELAAKVTVPAKLFTLARLIVKVPDEPALRVRLVELVEVEKVGGGSIVAKTVVECEVFPAVPLTVTVQTPLSADAEIVSVADADPPGESRRLAGERLAEQLGEDGVAEKATVPMKLFTLVTIIVELANIPGRIVTLTGIALTVKSGVGGGTVTVTRTATEWTIDPLVPVTTAV